METSKVRKFWTSNPFYPELSGALVTFYTIVIFVCSGVFLIWISFPPHSYIFWVFFCLSYFFTHWWRSKNKTKQKKKPPQVKSEEKKTYFHPLWVFFPYTIFFFYFWLFLVIFFLIMYCWNSFSGIHLKQLLGKPSSMGDVRFSTYINLKFYMLLRSGVGVCSSSEYFHIASS